MENQPSIDLGDALIDRAKPVLRIFALLVLSGLILWGAPTVLWIGYCIVGSVIQDSKIYYFDSGKALGQTEAQLDRRFPRESYSPGGNTVHYDLGWVFLTHYYAEVQFDPNTGKAISAKSVYDDW